MREGITRKYFSAAQVARPPRTPGGWPRLVGPCRASAAVSSEISSIRDVEAVGVHGQPAQAGLGRRPAVHLLVQPRHRAVVDDLALAVAPVGVHDLADLHLGACRG